jgi:hypothetical protein
MWALLTLNDLALVLTQSFTRILQIRGKRLRGHKVERDLQGVVGAKNIWVQPAECAKEICRWYIRAEYDGGVLPDSFLAPRRFRAQYLESEQVLPELAVESSRHLA